MNPPQQIIMIEDLADALHACDLARLAHFPRELMLRRDPCVPSRIKHNMRAAPLACAIDYALSALEFDSYDPRMWCIAPPLSAAPSAPLDPAAPAPASSDRREAPCPSPAARQRVADTPVFTVLDWFLQQFPELIDAPLDSIGLNSDLYQFEGPTIHFDDDDAFGGGAAANGGGFNVHRLTPLMRTLVALLRPLAALAVLERLLAKGVRLDPPPPGTNRSPVYIDLNLSPLCFALDTPPLDGGAHAIRMLIAAGARLAPGEVPIAVQRCIVWASAYGHLPRAIGAAAALRSLIPLRIAAEGGVAALGLAAQNAGQGGGRSGLFETLDEQRRAATLWLEDGYGDPEVLDALRLLGLRMDVVRAVVDRAHAPPQALLLRDAEAASGERVMRTLAVRGLGERLTPEIVSDIIARHANADPPSSWQMGIGPIARAPRSAAIEAADARAAQRRAQQR